MSADVGDARDETGENRSLDGTEAAEDAGEATEAAAADRREHRLERLVTHVRLRVRRSPEPSVDGAAASCPRRASATRALAPSALLLPSVPVVMTGRDILRSAVDGDDVGFDPETVELADEDVLGRLSAPVREWWVDQFGAYVDENGGFFTPPQREAVPRIGDGENVLVASPTGSGKCVRPDTPVLVRTGGDARLLRATEMKRHRTSKLADVDESGELHDSDLEAYSLAGDDVECRDSFVYTEQYSGDLHRIETTYGREVEVTPDHPLLVETADGREWVRAADVSEGDRIGVPAELDLPARPVDPDVDAALAALRDRYPVVLTSVDASRVRSALDTAAGVETLSERTRREALALADCSTSAVADRLGVGTATVHGLVTGESSHRGAAFLDLLCDEVSDLGDREVLVKRDDGEVEQFRHPETVDDEIVTFTAFVLAEGVIGEYDGACRLVASQRRREGLLSDVLEVARERFGVDVDVRDEPGPDYTVGKSAFGLFVSEWLGIDRGRGRAGRFPDWVLNMPEELKRTFVSAFLSLEAAVRPNEVRVVQADEMRVEQLNTLLLSFGLLPSRRTVERAATNTDDQAYRECYELAVRGEPDLERLVSEFDVRHGRTEEVRPDADGGTSGAPVDRHAFDDEEIRRLSKQLEDDEAFDEALGSVHEAVRQSGYVTDRASETPDGAASERPDDAVTRDVREGRARRRDQNVSWLEVTSTEIVSYDGEVVDLSVPEARNFVGGRGALYLHNTLSAFTAILDDLFTRAREREDGLENSVHCLYVSPLKSLANDIGRNLAVPIDGIAARVDGDAEVRHAIRHGDTSDADRRAMLETTPHVLNTTPETLAILLNSPKFKEKLSTVEYVVVDEIHSLAANKRGTHLAVSLERLEAMCEGSPVRIGCSATVEPLDEVAEFLVGRASPGGEPRPYELVDTRFVREFDLSLECPTDDLIDTPRNVVSERFYDRLDELVAGHDSTLVFTNTRSGAERVLHNLRGRGGYDESNSACHHGSLSKDRRQAVETALKEGSLDVVTTSTSLELGIDMPHIDLVVQVGSPKSVASLLQRVGRAGHQLGQTVEGRVVALDRDELVECAVMLQRAEDGFVDRVFVPENAADVATQHVYGMAINGPRRESAVRETLERAYPYREFGDEAWERLLRYLTADYDGLEEKNVYAKVWRDENDPPDGEHHYESFPVGEPLIGKRGRMARVIYMTNIGTIPDSFTIDVYRRSEDEWVGQLDENYLDKLETGDVFVLGGSRYEFRYRRGSKAYVDPTSARPNVPSWFSERLPLSYDLGREILSFQGDLLDRLATGGRPAVREWLRGFPLDENSVRAVARAFDEQARYAGRESVSTGCRLAVEVERDRDDYQRRYYVHSNYGRRFNDGLSRLVAYRCSRRANANVKVAVADHGFVVSMPLNRRVDIADVLGSIAPDEVRPDLRAALDGTELLKRYFRIDATRALMILKRYKGYEKSAAEQQVSSEMLLSFAQELEEFAVIEETYREILEDKLHVEGIEEVMEAVQSGEVTVTEQTVESPSPKAFGLATLMASDVVLADDEGQVLREFHERVLSEIGDDDGVAVDGED